MLKVKMAKRKNPAAVALAKLRAASLTAEERTEIARKAGGAGGKAADLHRAGGSDRGE